MSFARVTAALPLLLLLGACVTINIYFPAAAAEKAADQIIQDVWGQPPGEEGSGESATDEATPEPQSFLEAPHPGWTPLDWLIPAAHAASADIDVSTPAINRIKQSMKQRHSKLQPHYQSGAVGLTNDGLLAVRDASAVPLPQRAQVNALVAAENRDRKALYEEIARANGHPEWEDDIRRTFAERWVANARPGWWYQTSGGQWKQK